MLVYYHCNKKHQILSLFLEEQIAEQLEAFCYLTFQSIL